MRSAHAALVILGFKEDAFGLLFAPILLSKLPKHIRLDLRRQKKQSGNAPWGMERLRKMLSTEIELRRMNDHQMFEPPCKAQRPNDGSE